MKLEPLRVQISLPSPWRTQSVWSSSDTYAFTQFPMLLQVLLATLSDNVVVSKQTGKVRDKDRTWDSVKKSLLGNINGFLEELKVWPHGNSTSRWFSYCEKSRFSSIL